MLQGITLPAAAKVCAAVCLTGGAGITTYRVADLGEDTTTVAATEAAPAALAFDEEPRQDSTELLVDVTTGETEMAANLEAVEPPAETKTEPEDETKTEPEEKEEGDTTAPEIVVLSPAADSKHDEAKLVFEGETEPGATVKAGPYLADVDEEGNWRIELILSPGANSTTFSATDEAGNIGFVTVKVWLIEEEPEKKEEPHDKDGEAKPDEKEDKVDVVDVKFSANQKYGSCDADKPYDVFWGTATPGSKVTISSPYGSATVEVNEKGHWEKKVYFEEAPIGETFTVTVTATNGSETFSYVVKPAPTEKDEPKSEDKTSEETAPKE